MHNVFYENWYFCHIKANLKNVQKSINLRVDIANRNLIAYGIFALNEYDLKDPSGDLWSQRIALRSSEHNDQEMYND